MRSAPRSLFRRITPSFDSLRQLQSEVSACSSALALASRDVIHASGNSSLSSYHRDLLRSRQRDLASALVRAVSALVIASTEGAELCALDATAGSHLPEALVHDALVSIGLNNLPDPSLARGSDNE